LQTCPNEVDEALTVMVEALNARTESTAQRGIDRRKEPRLESCAKCDLWVFGEQGHEKKVADVVTRNHSFCGLSLLARLPEPLVMGRPIEVVVGTPGASPTHVAGTTAFCRKMGPRYYEIGIRVRAVGSTWILADNVEASKARYDWFAEALQIPVL